MLPESFKKAGRIFVVSFQGWNDAGDASSQAVSMFREQADVEHIFRMEDEEFFDYQFIRPIIKVNPHGGKSITWPAVEFAFTTPNIASDLEYVFVEGVEPSRSWRTFADEFVELLVDHDAVGVVFVGALLADTPHTRPSPVHVTSDNTAVQQQLGISASKYEGPVGIISVLSEQAEADGIPTINIWASVPHYAHGSPCPLAALELTKKISELLELPIETVDLEHQAKIWAESVTDQIEDDADLRGYVEQLEKMYDTEESFEASGDAIAEEFEKYLRNATEDGENNSEEDDTSPDGTPSDGSPFDEH